jgi:hypothetical protein
MSTYAERQRHWDQLRARQAADAEHRARTAHLRRDLEIERLRALYADTPDIPRAPRKKRSRGRKWTEEQRKRASLNADRERLSRQSRAWWRTLKSDPARYEAMCRHAAKKARLAWTPERRAQWSEHMRQKWASGEWGAHQQAALEARWTEGARAEQAERMRQKWASPKARKRLVQKISQAWTADRRAEQTQRARRAWTPERRAQWSEHMRAKKLAEAAADPRPARAVAMRREGVLIRDIATEFQVSQSTVKRWVKRVKEAGEL